jgi:hypothetical protein
VLAVKFLIAFPSLSFFLHRPSYAIFMDLLSDLVVWMSETSEAGGRRSVGCCHLFASFKYCPGPKAGTASALPVPTGFVEIHFKNLSFYFFNRKKQSVCVLTDGFPVRSSSGRYLVFTLARLYSQGCCNCCCQLGRVLLAFF